MSDIENEFTLTPEDISTRANTAINKLLPEKPKNQYEKVYDQFIEWKTKHDVTMTSVEVVEISTKLGKLKGLVKKSAGISNTTYYSFQGIPYAKPPVGKLRFKSPEPSGKWEGVHDATKEGNDCAQKHQYFQNLFGSEDCLYLNVYTPQVCLAYSRPPQSQDSVPNNDNTSTNHHDTVGNKCEEINQRDLNTHQQERKQARLLYQLDRFTGRTGKEKPGKGDSKKPVMVFIHGGGFLGGSSSTQMYGPDFFVEKDILLVTINYRCGALGFLSLENDKVPGNAGLKDQNLALRWVQENIDSFGGDFKNVTIFGESAGAAAVHYQILSPLSKGLFHKAILQSGFSLCQWALQTNPKEKALLLAKELGCTSQDTDEVLEFLMSVPALDIVEAQLKEVLKSYKEALHKITIVFTPCVEPAGREPFLSDYPRKLMERGDFNKVPVIIGVTEKEGLITGEANLINFEKINADSTLVVPFDLKIKRGGEEERKLGKEILQFYTNKEALSWDDIHGYVDLFSDVMFSVGMESSRQSFLKHSNSPLYTYLFTYASPRAISSILLPIHYPDHAAQLIKIGVCHADELVHQFKTNFAQAPFIAPTDDDQVFMDKFLKAWTNFAKTGDPNSKEIEATWRPDNIKSPHFLELGKVCKAVDGTVFPKRLEFWKKLYENYSFAY